MQKELQAHLSVLCRKANTFFFNYWLPPGSGLPQPSAYSGNVKTLAYLSPLFQTWQENSTLPNTSVPPALARAQVPALWGAVTGLLMGWKMCWCSPGWEGLPGCSRGFSAPEIHLAHSALTELKGFRVLAVASEAQQAPRPGKHSNNNPVVSLVFPELLLQGSSLNSASDKSEGTCL